MTAETHSFIDIAALDAVRAHFAAADAVAILSLDLTLMLWANGPGARLFGFSGIEAAIGADAGLSRTARRQIEAAPGFPQVGTGRAISVRLAGGVHSQAVTLRASHITLPGGDEAIMLVAPLAATGARDAAEIAARAIGGFEEDGNYLAFIADGAILAATEGFAALGIDRGTLARLADDVSGESDRLLKRIIRIDGRTMPVGFARLRDTPPLDLLITVDERWPQDDAASAAELPDGAAAPAAGHSEPGATVPADQPVAALELPAEATDEGRGAAPVRQTAANPAVDGEAAAGLPAAPPVPADATSPPDDSWYFGEPTTGSGPAGEIDRHAAPVRFVWRTDAAGRFQTISPEFSAAVGAAAADIVGRTFAAVAKRLQLDPEGEIAGLLERRDTWSGRSVLWPIAGTDLKAPVDLAALPAYDRERTFEGFRGFGVVRRADALVDPAGIGLSLDGWPEGADDSAEPKSDAPTAEGADPFHGEVPALALDAKQGRRFTDKVIRLAEHRVPANDKGLTPLERNAFREIGEQLKRSSGEAPSGETPGDAGIAGAEEAKPTATGAAQTEPVAPPATTRAVEAADAAAWWEPAGTTDPLKTRPADAENVDAAARTAPVDPAVDAEPPTRAGAVASEPDQAFAPEIAAEPSAEQEPSAEPHSDTTSGSLADGADATIDADATAVRDIEPAADAGAGVALESPTSTTIAEGAEPADAAEAKEPNGNDATNAELWRTRVSRSLLDFADDAAGRDATGSGIERLPAPVADTSTDAGITLSAGPEPEAAAAPASEPEPTPVDTPQLTAPTDATQREMPETSVVEAGSAVPEAGAAPVTPVAHPPRLKQAGFLPSAFAERHTNQRRADTSILAQLPTPVLIHSGDTLHYANAAFLDLTGYASLDTLAEQGGLDAILSGPADNRIEGDNRVTLRRRNGEELLVNAFLQSVPWLGGKALLLTLARQTAPATPEAAPSPPAAAELEARVAELRTILDTATDGVVLIGNDETIRSISRPAEALFGYDSGQIVGRPFTSLFAIESQRSARDYLSGLSENGVASVLNDGREVIGREAQGRFIPLFMTIGRLPGDSGFCAVLRDITQWKRAEEDLTQARAQAERTSSQKSDFLARISHEIRTPLNAIIGFSELMLDEKFGPVANDRYRDYLRDINRSGNHVLDLVNDLLDISKIEAGQQELDYEAVALNDALAETVAMMQPQANRERVIIRSSFASRLPEVVADLRSIRQIALNILSNAVRYTQAGGQVIVSTAYEPNGEVVMRVRDTGIGMTQAEIEQALKPFKQINALKRARGDGTGLGLPLTKAMVEANRAKFSIISTPGEGTLVEIAFPSTRVLAD